MIRVDRLGVIDHIINASQRGATVKIICPFSEENSNIIRKIDEQASAVKVLNGNHSPFGMYIIDSEKFLRAEVKEPQAETFSEAIGFAVYSNSKLSVDFFRSVFELLWNEHTLNEELKRADKMQKQFINIAAHELRTPIQPILGLLGLLRSRKTEIKKQELDASLDLIMRNALRLKRLAEDILDVSKIESRSLVMHKELLNLNEAISGAVQDIIKNQLDSRGGQISYEPIEDTILVEADRFRLIQVVSNLLSNAVKFTKRNGGTIQISMKKKDDYGQEVALVSVKDTGIGIDPEIFPRLFEKFASNSFQGTGLGLFLSRSIIEAQGGRIWAENNTDGQNGATFYFTLPITSNKRDSEKQRRVILKTKTTKTTTKTKDNGKMKNILIVDDEPDVCTVLKQVLEQYGFSADSYDDPILALENFKTGLYELLLLDIKMPEMNGFLLYQEMKKIDNKIKVCFLTASEMYYEEFRKEEFCGLDKDLFLRKPIRNEDLFNEISRIINSN